MDKKATKKQVQKLKKEIDEAICFLGKLELRPCHNDAEIIQKETEVEGLKSHIHSLETKRNSLIYSG